MGDNTTAVHFGVKPDIPEPECDILLVPPVINPFFSVDLQRFMPLGLLALAAGLRQHGFRPQIYRPRKRLISEEDYQAVALDILETQPSIIGFSSWCISYAASLWLARQIKNLRPEIPLIFGGPQASLLSRETLAEFGHVDFVLAGEADFTLPALVNSLLNGNHPDDLSRIPGLAFRVNGRLHINGSPGFVADLKRLPVPAYDLVKTADALKIDAGRGCPFHCTYCSTNTFFSKKYRTKSPERILEEMNRAFLEEGITRFSFAHDLFTLNRRFVLDLCRKLVRQQKNKGPKFTWTCSARIDTVTGEMLRAMKRAGCQSVFFGIESGSDKIQRSIQKNLKVTDAYRIADICRQLGMAMHASFIAGFPEETEQDIEMTLHAIVQLAARGARVQISELSVLPGTSIFREHHNKLTFDGRFSNFSDCICTREEIQLITSFPDVFSSFYYLPVETLDREEMHLLGHFINYLGDFRHTLARIRNIILCDLEKADLQGSFRSVLPRFSQHLLSGLPPVSFMVRLLGEYLASRPESQLPAGTGDIYHYESSCAILVSAYLRSRLIDPSGCHIPGLFGGEVPCNSGQPLYPAKVISTKVDLRWLLNTGKDIPGSASYPASGKYFYLLMAVSEIKFIHLKINKKELSVLMALTPSRSHDLTQGMAFISPGSFPLSLTKKIERNKIVIPPPC